MLATCCRLVSTMVYLEQSTLQKRVVWRLIAAVGTMAEDCVVAGLQQLVLWQRIVWQLAWEWSILQKRVGQRLLSTNLTAAYADTLVTFQVC